MRPSKVSVRVSPQSSDRDGASPGHKPRLDTTQNDFANVRDSDEFIGEDASGPAGQLIVTIEEGCRSVVKTSTAAAVRAPTAPQRPACLLRAIKGLWRRLHNPLGLSSIPESEALAARMPRRGCGGVGGRGSVA
jgi:hypothetical protein